MSRSRWIFVLIVILIISSFSYSPVFAGPDADNSLDLNVHNKGENIGISLYTGYPSTERAILLPSGAITTITIDVPISKKIVKSWLYIYTAYYDSGTYSTIKVNGNTIVGNLHIIPTGEDRNRQLLRVDNVTQYINSGLNEVKFQITRFGSFDEVSVDGASLIVAYEDTPLREYWIYDGTEYLNAKEATAPQTDISYTRTFLDPQYVSAKDAELYVAYHNGHEPLDILEFNGNELTDDSAETLADTYYLHIMKFNVKDLLTTQNSLTFTFPKYKPIAGLWPAIVLLSVETEDTTSPSVTISTPADESLVSGEIEIKGSIDDPTATISLLIDGSEESTSLPYTWNTSSVSDGSYEIKVEATDPASNKGSKIITVEVDNTPPSVSITSLANGSDVKGTVEITGTAVDANLDKISLEIDGVEVSSTLPFSWNTSAYSNGSHVIELSATDLKNNTASALIDVNVANPPITTPPPTTPAPTTPPPVTLPPSTVVPTTIPPQTTAPPIEEVDIGIQILSISPQTATEGEEVGIKLLVINYNDKRADGKVELYVGDGTFDRMESESIKIEALESRTLEYSINIKDSRAYEGAGRYKIKAVVNVGLDVIDSNEDNNEDLDHLNIEKKPRISLAWLWPILKWVVVIAVIIGVVRVIQVQMSPERDYLR